MEQKPMKMKSVSLVSRNMVSGFLEMLEPFIGGHAKIDT